MKESTDYEFPLSLPEGFRGRRGKGRFVAGKGDDFVFLEESGLLDGPLPPLSNDGSFAGRGNLVPVSLPSGPALAKTLRHGGLLRFVSGERFWGWSRPFEELCLSAKVRQAGVLTPEVLGAAAVKKGIFYRLMIFSRRIEGRDLARFLLETAPGPSRDGVLNMAGAAIRKFHDAGFFHNDLHPKNLFVEGGSDKIYLLDLDRSTSAAPVSEEKRSRNLTRLFRYGERRAALGEPTSLSRDDFRCLLRGYDEQREEFWYRGVESRFHRGAWVHRLGWRIESLFS